MSLELLARTALLGTGRVAGPTLDAQLSALAISDDPPRSLLRQAAWCALSERAGWMPAQSALSMPECLPEQLRAIKNESVVVLFEVLAREDARLVSECLRQITEHGLRVDEKLLPRMFEQCSDPLLRAQLIAAGGQMAQWLIKLNPQWAVALVSATDLNWTDGNLAQRLAFLKAERERHPGAARERLQSTFAAEPPAARAELLGALANGLNLDDEPFLESVLADQRKEVRRAAIELLQRLPQSALVLRAWALAQPLLEFKPGGWLRKHSLELILPETCTAAMQRDGIEVKPPAASRSGERGYWLEELLARIPPQQWSDAFGQDAQTIWGLSEKHEFAQVLRRGWLRAAANFGDLNWAQIGIADGALHSFHDPSVVQLAECIAAAPDAEQRIAAHLRMHPDEAPELLLSALKSPWSAAFSAELLRWLRQRWIDRAKKGHEYLMHSTLKIAAHALDPRNPIDEHGWVQDSQARVPKALSDFFGTLGLRRAFLHSLLSDRS